jgi:hypothetical protein
MCEPDGEQRIRQFTQAIDDLHRGCYPPRFTHLDAAIQALLDDILLAPWGSTQERSQAQGLVVRLEWLRRPKEDDSPVFLAGTVHLPLPCSSGGKKQPQGSPAFDQGRRPRRRA